MEAKRLKTRRHYSAEQRAQVLAQCEAPGASVAKVANAHGIHVSVVHGWRQLVRGANSVQGRAASRRPQAQPAPQAKTLFVPVALGPAAPRARAALGAQHVEANLQRGGVAMTVVWPLAALHEFAAWSREVLR